MEAYAEGDFIGTKMGWSTWSGSPGGADDARVSTEEAHSGTNSVKFASFSANGGPEDVILVMPYRLANRGSLVFNFWIYVVEGTSAYYNFQGGSQVGQSWTAEMFFDDDGGLRVVSGGQEKLSGSFEHNKWFEVEWQIDFGRNAWETIVDGQCLGVFTNTAGNSVGSVDFYPTNTGNPSNNNSIFFIDDVSFTASTDGIPEVQTDAGLNTVNLKPKALVGQELAIGGSLRNNGTEAITSFEVSFDGAGLNFNETFDGVNIAAGETYDFETQESITVTEGSTDVSMSLVSVNGGADEKDCNDDRSGSVEGVVPAASKKVLCEEATGTWCQWCPRGEVFVNAMVAEYPDYFVPIAVHQGDPMENTHITYITSTIPGFAGYPNMVIDRNGWFGFGTIGAVENRFFDNIVNSAAGSIEVGAAWDAGRTLNISGAINWLEDSESGMSLDVILVENNVTGTGPGYAQANAYSGGANGPMGGYENLPHPVPADQMVYGHVSRGSVTLNAGQPISDSYTAGQRHIANFQVDVPAEYDDAELYLVCILLNSDGSTNNVFEASLQDAIDHGFEMATSSEDIASLNSLSVYPNPAVNRTFIDLDLEESSNVTIQVVNNLGQVVTQRDYGQMSGKYVFPVDLSNMPTGMYDIQIFVNDAYTTKRLSVVK